MLHQPALETFKCKDTEPQSATAGRYNRKDTKCLVCLQLGAILSATDPVAAMAVLAEVGAPRPQRTIIEGESLGDDGTAHVLFFLLRVSWAQ